MFLVTLINDKHTQTEDTVYMIFQDSTLQLTKVMVLGEGAKERQRVLFEKFQQYIFFYSPLKLERLQKVPCSQSDEHN